MLARRSPLEEERAVSRIVAAALSLLAAALLAAAPAHARERVPVVFVHGNTGSAQQFETNAMRFTSNGYRHGELFVYEYDSTASTNDAAIAGLDAFLADVRAKTGAPKVDLLAHSRGTTISLAFLSTPARAAHVRRYVNFDGRSAPSLPGGVPSLGVWGEGDPDRAIGGGENVYFPEKSHTEVATSAEAFAEVYEFLNGREPRTTHVVPERPDKVRVSGRVTNFPQNTGLEGAELELYEVDPATGQRKSSRPRLTRVIGADGAWGPLRLNGRKRYELAVTRPDGLVQHFYFLPFERSNHFVRLQTSPEGGIGELLERGPKHSAFVVLRMREWRSDQTAPGANDRLEIAGTNVLTPPIAPRARRLLGAFVFDSGSDGVTSLSAPVPPFGGLPFLTAADHYVKANPYGRGTVRLTETARDWGRRSTVAVPNWPSILHVPTVQFKDYEVRR
jgi:pimeloyl-ACP methyl ester carboxylesterase